MLGRLFLRTLPEEFTDNSVYAWFPLMTPAAMDEILTDLDQKAKYDFERPGTTHGTREFKEYGRYLGFSQNKEKFRHPFLNRVSKVVHGPGFFLATDTPERGEREQRRCSRDWRRPQNKSTHHQVLLRKHQGSHRQGVVQACGWRESALDIVRDVFRVVPIQWVATQVVSEAASSRASAAC
jgi:linoleate 10R-lipoxygenase